VRAHAAVNTGASKERKRESWLSRVVVPYTYEQAQVPAGPAGVCFALALPAPIADGAHIRLFFLQSAQLLFDSSLTRLFSVARFTSARSAAGLGRRDMVGRVSCARKVVLASAGSRSGEEEGELREQRLAGVSGAGL
jgi:hypothetical protein